MPELTLSRAIQNDASALPAHALGLDTYPRLLPVGDTALSVEFGDSIDPAINARVAALDLALSASELPGLVEITPSYRALLICYEPVQLSFDALVAAVRELIRAGETAPATVPRCWHVPVWYGPPHGEDLGAVARHCRLAPEDVVAAHTQTEFGVYFVGFAPGVPIMGRLPEQLLIPRRKQPRPNVPAGSVLIAGAQATLLSRTMPSGWHILGRTPVRAFRSGRADPCLFRPGDRVRFRVVGEAEFDALSAVAARGGDVATLEAA